MDSKTLCLAVLLDGPASGYEIKKALESAPLSHFQETSFGAIYPALTRLASQGLIAGSELAQDKRPDKKVYRLTAAGHAELVEALMRPPAPDKFRSDFLLVLYLGDLLPPERVMEVIDARIAALEEDARQTRACGVAELSATQAFVQRFGLAYYEFAAQWLRNNRDRLSRELGDTRPQVAHQG